MDNEKKLSEISRKDWIVWQWAETEMYFGDTERTFIRGQKRTPTEALQAAEEWEFLKSVEGEDEAVEN
jgi:hypothetical protein